MFNHLGLLTLKAQTTEAELQGIADALLALPGQVEGLLSASVVKDAGLQDGNASLRFLMRFSSVEAWQGYRTHPAHVAVVKGFIAPCLESKSFVQFDDANEQVRVLEGVNEN